jgi:hypothetical protein
MSDHAHAGAADAHGHSHGHDEHHHAAYEGTPANEPGPGEPATPGWLTLLGISLVLALLLGWVATRPDGKTRAELTPSGAASVAAAAPSPAPRPDRPTPPAARPAPVAAAPSGFVPRLAPSVGIRPVRPGQFAVQRPNAPQ